MSEITDALYELMNDYTKLREYERFKLANMHPMEKQFAACIQERVSTYDITIRLLINKLYLIKEIEKQ